MKSQLFCRHFEPLRIHVSLVKGWLVYV